MKCYYEGTGVFEGLCLGTKECDSCIGYERCATFKPDTMTNADRIRAMSDEELAEFLCSIAYARSTPWSEPFETKFCRRCPTVVATIKETGETMDLRECDFVDGKCPHGIDTVWWLKQPVKDGDNDG